MNGVVWVPVLCSPLLVAVLSCLPTAKRDDEDLERQEADHVRLVAAGRADDREDER